MSLVNYVYLATILFVIGGATVLTRRNAIIVFMGVELMLNATNLALVTFSRMHGALDGQVMALFVMVVAAAEVVEPDRAVHDLRRVDGVGPEVGQCDSPVEDLRGGDRGGSEVVGPDAAVEDLRRNGRAIGRGHHHDALGTELREHAQAIDHERVVPADAVARAAEQDLGLWSKDAGDQREELERLVLAVNDALPTGRLEVTGDRATLAFGAGGTVELLRERGLWKIEDLR